MTDNKIIHKDNPDSLHYLGRIKKAKKGISSLTYENNQFINFGSIPLFYNDSHIVEVPQALRQIIHRIHLTELRIINQAPAVAIDQIYLLLSMFSGSCIRSIKGEGKGKYVSLSTKYLQTLFGKIKNKNVYLKILEVLQHHKILFLHKKYSVGRFNNVYYLHDRHLCGTYIHKMKSIIGKTLLSNLYTKKYEEAIENPISSHLMQSYQYITLPDKSTLEGIGKQLAKDKETTNKGKLYTWKGNKTRDHWKEPKRRAFIEDHIKAFELLTSKEHTQSGFMLPMPSGIRGGGRVVDSFTLCPSWIRKEIKIKKGKITELDFKCLHPNLAVNIYAPEKEKKNITHDIAAKYLEIDRGAAKNEHLSFFNKPVTFLKLYGQDYIPGMNNSPLWKYYQDNYPEMMKAISKDKKLYGYRITSQRLLQAETKIMTSIIKELNILSVPCIYVYDALYVQESKADQVRKIMNNTSRDMGILTTVKQP